jgi:predicted dehydrogenase
MNGVTGRMGANQHLSRSLLAIRDAGGVSLADGTKLVPEPVLVGRNAGRLAALAARHGLARWTTDLTGALADPSLEIYFDAQATPARQASVTAAINAGKHVYCEKPSAADLEGALELARLGRRRGVRNGVVQDKLFLPGLVKLRSVLARGLLGQVLAVRGEFGYWVFERGEPLQRPSWNYRAEEGGGIIVDMLCHWRYLLDDLFGSVRAVSCLGATHVPRRADEHGSEYRCTAEDAAYATFQLEGGVIAQINSSWAVRVYRDDLFVLQVDGSEGSAVATLRECRIQSRAATPRAVWNPDLPAALDFRAHWEEVPEVEPPVNAFRRQWELYLRHVAAGEPFPWDLLAGARGIQLAELALRSWRERRWIEVPELGLDGDA